MKNEMFTKSCSSLSAKEQNAILATSVSATSSYANSHFPGFFSKDEISDIAGDVNYRACRSISTFNPNKSSLSGWVYSISCNRVKSACEKKLRELPTISIVYDEDGEPAVSGVDETYRTDDFSCTRDLEYQEFERDVRRVISSTLREDDIRILGYIEYGMTPEEIAQTEGISANLASVRKHRIRERLREPLMEVAREYDVPVTWLNKIK